MKEQIIQSCSVCDYCKHGPQSSCKESQDCECFGDKEAIQFCGKEVIGILYIREIFKIICLTMEKFAIWDKVGEIYYLMKRFIR